MGPSSMHRPADTNPPAEVRDVSFCLPGVIVLRSCSGSAAAHLEFTRRSTF